MTGAVDADHPLRADFYRERFPDFWANIAGEPYAMLDIHPMSHAAIACVRAAAADAWSMMARVASVMRAMPDDALEACGIPAAALRVCRSYDPSIGPSLVARFDFALTSGGPKVLELNAETPMFLWESYEIAGATARPRGFIDPNDGQLDALGAAVARAVGPNENVRLAVTAYNTWREDWFSAVFLARVASDALRRNVDVIPLHELRVGTAALVDANGSPIDVLWRLYPLEHIAADRDGPKLFDLVERGRLRLINPPCALLMQNKAALAILWELAQSNAWFDATERALIERLFLPTFLDLPATDAVFVRKPVLGREGDSVAIVRGSQTLTESASRTYIAQPVVYQQFVPLPRAHGGQAIVTCFVIAGAPGAVAMRVGGEITDGHARFMSIGAT